MTAVLEAFQPAALVTVAAAMLEPLPRERSEARRPALPNDDLGRMPEDDTLPA